MDLLFSVGSILLGTAATLAILNAVDRRIFMIGFPWVEEFYTYCIVIGVFISIPLLELRDDHLSIGIIQTIVKNKKIIKALFIIRGLVTVTFLCTVVWYGLISIQSQINTGAVTFVLRWPKSTLYSVGVAGYAMSILSWLTIFIFNKGDKVDAN